MDAKSLLHGYQHCITALKERELSGDDHSHSALSIWSCWARRKYMQQMNPAHMSGPAVQAPGNIKVFGQRLFPQGTPWEEQSWRNRWWFWCSDRGALR